MTHFQLWSDWELRVRVSWRTLAARHDCGSPTSSGVEDVTCGRALLHSDASVESWWEGASASATGGGAARVGGGGGTAAGRGPAAAASASAAASAPALASASSAAAAFAPASRCTPEMEVTEERERERLGIPNRRMQYLEVFEEPCRRHEAAGYLHAGLAYSLMVLKQSAVSH